MAYETAARWAKSQRAGLKEEKVLHDYAVMNAARSELKVSIETFNNSSNKLRALGLQDSYLAADNENCKGRIYLRRGEYEQSASAFRAAIAKMPDKCDPCGLWRSVAQAYLGVCCTRCNDPKAGENELISAIRIMESQGRRDMPEYRMAIDELERCQATAQRPRQPF